MRSSSKSAAATIVKCLAALVLSLSWLPAAVAATDMVVPVNVVVQISHPSLKSAWGDPGVAAVQRSVAKRLVEKLGNQFKYWKIQAGPAGRRTLLLDVMHRLDNRVDMVLTAKSSGAPATILDTVWLEPGDIGMSGFPAVGLAADQIFNAFNTKFGNVSSKSLERWLMDTVPIAAGGNEWMQRAPADTLRIKTPLVTSEYEGLRISHFRIACLVSGELVDVLGRGAIQDGENVLIVKAKDRRKDDASDPIDISNAAEVLQYKLGPIYVSEIVEPSDFDFLGEF